MPGKISAASLTRKDVRDEIDSALDKFAEEAFQKKLAELEKKMQSQQDRLKESVEQALASTAGKESFRREVRSALDEWWASRGEPGSPVPPSSPLGPASPEVPSRWPGPPRSLPSSPQMLPASALLAVPPSPFASPPASPSITAVSSPVFTAVSTSSGGGSPVHRNSRNGGPSWRNNFVQQIQRAHKKLEYVHGSQCRETQELNDVLDEAARALDGGTKPDLVEDGLGGTYFIKNSEGKSIAVFKPRDEEPLGLNNPKVHVGGGTGSGLKEGVLVGEAAINEYAAFLLDHMSDACLRAGVCPTALVRVEHSVFHSAEESRTDVFRSKKDKVGSFQLFAQHDCTSEDLGPSMFPADQVHRIAVLDIRLCNVDRHSGNLLVRETAAGKVSVLVPIDHGYALPGEIGDATFEWLSWPAAKMPFSEEMRQRIAEIDVNAVEGALKKRVPILRKECLMTLRICTMLLRRGAEAGLTAFDIGTLMTREYSPDDEPQTPSELGALVVLARSTLEPDEADGPAAASPDAAFLKRLDALLLLRCREVAEESGRPAANDM